MNTRDIILAIIVVAGAAVIYFLPRESKAPDVIAIYDFATCAEAGYPVAESQPRTCRTPNGTVYTETNQENPEVIVETPTQNALVTSPLRVKGKARGFWFFEANLPVTLKDQNGKILAQKGFQAKGEWMTTDHVEFEDTLTFQTPTTEFGVLLIEKDNASGLPQFDASFAVPVRFR